MAQRIDWNKVKALSLDAGNAPKDWAFFLLPVAGRDLLQASNEVLEWEATYRAFDYDFSDWDFLQEIVHKTQNGLMGGIMLADLLDYLERIAITLEDTSEFDLMVDAIEGISVTATADATATGGGAGCCPVDKQFKLPPDWQDDWPAEPEAEDETEYVGTDAWLCDAAHSTHAAIRQWYANFAGNVVAESPYAEVASDIAELGLGNVYAAALWEIMTAVTSVYYDGLSDDVDAFWMSIKDEYICKMIEDGMNSKAFKAWLLTKLRDEAPSWTVGWYMETLLTGTNFNVVYDGTYTVRPEFIGSTCDCAPSYFSPPEGYVLVPLLDSEVNIQSSTTASMAYDDTLNLFSHVDISADTFHIIDVLCDASEIKTRVNGDEIVGGVVEFLADRTSWNGNDSIAAFPTTNGSLFGYEAGAFKLAFQGAEYANVVEYRNWVDNWPASWRDNYGNNDALMQWESRTYNPVAENMNYRIWAVVRLI